MANKGLVSIIGIVIIAVLVAMALNYFHLTVKVTVEKSPTSVEKGETLPGKSLWNDYFQKPVESLLKFFEDLIDYIVRNVKNLSSGGVTGGVRVPGSPY
ncbi:MAG: hypothetical protein AAB500_02435 [Patescibacteria group bacterium]